MIQPTSTEVMYQALFTLLSQTQLSGSAAFVTSSRRLPQVSTVSPANQPALYMLESEENVTEHENGLPVFEHKVAAVVLFRNNSSTSTVASSQLNALRDAVFTQLQSFTLASDQQTVIAKPLGERQTLGGIVYHCRILGRVLKNEGLQNQQGAIVFPISILAGM